jgi:TetR/AcrR family fatty acid metabolism transcriptional regulator
MKNDNIKKKLTGKERKDQIIKNTIDLVSEKGFKSVTTRDIAIRSQINEALIFQHFKTKQELMMEAVREIINKRTESIGEMEIPSCEQEFIEKLYLYEEFFLTLNIENPTYLKIILYYILEGYPISDEVTIQNDKILIKWIYESIEKGKKEWGFDKDIDNEIAISSFIGGLTYFILRNVIMNKSIINLEDIKYKFVQTFINSLKV